MDAVDNKSMQSCVNIEQSNTLEASTNYKGSINQICNNQLLRELTKQCTINYEDFFKSVTNKQKPLDTSTTTQNVQLMNNCLTNSPTYLVHTNDNNLPNSPQLKTDVADDVNNEIEETENTSCNSHQKTPNNCNSVVGHDDTTPEVLPNTELTPPTVSLEETPQITTESETDKNSKEQNVDSSIEETSVKELSTELESNSPTTEIKLNSLNINLPVDYTSINNHVNEDNHSRHSRGTSVSSTASSSSTNSSSTNHLVIDQANIFDTLPLQQEQHDRQTEIEQEEEQEQEDVTEDEEQFSNKRKRKFSSSCSSTTDVEEPTAKHLHLDTAKCEEELRSPLKIKIKCTPKQTPEDEKVECNDTQKQIKTVEDNLQRTIHNNNNTFIAAPINVELGEKNEAIFGVREDNAKYQVSVASVETNISPSVTIPNKLPLMKCMQCQTFHEYGHFFMHAYQVHNRYLCLYCNGSFRTAEKLSVHLEIKHDLEQNHFNSEEAMRGYVFKVSQVENTDKYIMCCTCEHVFVDHEPFSNHDCSAYMQPCSLCGQMGRHSNNCKSHPDATRRNKNTANLQQKSKPPSKSICPQTVVTNCDTDTTNTSEQQQQKLSQIELSPFENNYEQYQMTNTNAIETVTQNEPTGACEEQEQHDVTDSADLSEELNAPKVVPKFKLRVPKEFQKAVDSAISSSDDSENEEASDTDEEDEEESAEVVPPLEQDKELENISNAAFENMSEENAQLEDLTTQSTAAEVEDKSKEIVEQEQQVAVAVAVAVDEPEAVETAAPAAELPESAAQQTNGPTEQWTHTPPASPTHAQETPTDPPTALIVPITDNNSNQELPCASTSGILTPKTSGTTLETATNDTETQAPIVTENAMPATETAENDETKPEEIISPESSFVDVEAAEDDIIPIDLSLEEPIDNYNAIDLVRACIKQSFPICLYCNHARRIAVNAHNLVLHLLENHRYNTVIAGNTLEKLDAKIICEKLQSFLPELEMEYINLCTYNSMELKNNASTGLKDYNERFYECFVCRFVSNTYKELYLHNRKWHLRATIYCFMCRVHFNNFSEILCHICPGKVVALTSIDLKYRCCLCNLTDIPSPFRLMVHLRMKHFSCDVCLENCFDQLRLSLHVFKHKVRHMCHRCNIAYRNKTDIENHLFWKHSTEGIKCRRCLRKRWRHVYHFCTPPSNFVCDICNMCFSKAVYLHVHARLHADELKYACKEEGCEEKFVARKLLEKHVAKSHIIEENPLAIKNEENKNVDVEVNSLLEKKMETELKENESEEQEKEMEQELTIKKTDSSDTEKPEDKEENKIKENIKESEKSKETVTKRKKNKKPKDLMHFLNLHAPNLSESDSSSSDEEYTTEENRTELLKELPTETAVKEHKEEEKEATENKMETNESVAADVIEAWNNNFAPDKDKNVTLDKKESIENMSTENEIESKKNEFHVGGGEHDYCRLDTPPLSPVKPKKRKISITLPEEKPIEPDNDSSSGSSSDDDSSSCCSKENCSCSDKESGNSSESDSSNVSNQSISPRKKNRNKESSKSPHKKHKETTDKSLKENENKELQLAAEQQEEEAAAANLIVENREPEFLESDLATSEEDSSEEFYDAHPQKDQNGFMQQHNAELKKTKSNTTTPFQENATYINGVDQLQTPIAHDSPTSKKKFKKKRDKRNALFNNKIHTQQPQLYHETIVSHNFTDNYLMDQNSVYNNNYATADGMHYPGHLMSFAAEQTVITAANAFSEGGGSSSEADGSLKRSKRNRRPNKFYGYTSDDDGINASFGQKMMIGMRAFKPTPPPQLTWHKEDLPSPSKSLLNNSKTKSTKLANTKSQSSDDLNADISTLVVPDNRVRTFGIAAGGKIGGNSAFYKRAAKRSNFKSRKVSSTEEEAHQLPPIPRLKIKPTANMKFANIGEQTRIMSEHTEGDMDAGSSSATSSSSEDEQVDNKPSRRRPGPSLNNTQIALNLPAPPMVTPVPKTKAFNHEIPPALLPNPDFATLQYFKVNNIRYPIRPPAGARLARDGESVYCYCRCPYDEVSEMIACDGDSCLIEWFHFECVGIMMAPQGKWYCAECRPKYVTEIYANKTQQPTLPQQQQQLQPQQP